MQIKKKPNLKMTTNLAHEILTKRNEFLEHLQNDLRKNEEIIITTTTMIDELTTTMENVKFFGNKVEHESLIPLGKNIYVNGVIKHTGEYFIDKLAFPESYSTVETLANTIKQLENKIKQQNEILNTSSLTKAQLETRMQLLQGNNDEEGEELPKEIISDKGIAMKMGQFYEILEFEN